MTVSAGTTAMRTYAEGDHSLRSDVQNRSVSQPMTALVVGANSLSFTLNHQYSYDYRTCTATGPGGVEENFTVALTSGSGVGEYSPSSGSIGPGRWNVTCGEMSRSATNS